MLLCFPSRLALPAVGQQGFFEVSPDMLHRMALVGLKAGVRIDGFARFSKALRVIREGRRDIEAKHVSLLETLSGIRTIFRGCFMGEQDAVRLILDHHDPVVRASWVVAVNVTLRRRGEGKKCRSIASGVGQGTPMSSIQRVLDAFVIGIRNSTEKRSALCLRLPPQTTAREPANRMTLWLIGWEVETP
jgi:hypothetical protein